MNPNRIEWIVTVGAALLLAVVIGGGEWFWPWPSPAPRWHSAAEAEAAIHAALPPPAAASTAPDPRLTVLTGDSLAAILRHTDASIESFDIDNVRVYRGMPLNALLSLVGWKNLIGLGARGDPNNASNTTLVRLYRIKDQTYAVVINKPPSVDQLRITAISRVKQ